MQYLHVSLFFVIVGSLSGRVYPIDTDTITQQLSINDGSSDFLIQKHIRSSGNNTVTRIETHSSSNEDSIPQLPHRYLQSTCVSTELELKAAIDAVPEIPLSTVGTITAPVNTIATDITICTRRLLITTGFEYKGEYFATANNKKIRFVCNYSTTCIIDGQGIGFGFLISSGGIISVVGITFQNFRSSPFRFTSNFYYKAAVTFENTNFLHNSNPRSGGAIFTIETILTLLGNCKFNNNTAQTGGAISMLVGQITANGKILFQNNTATTDSGGALSITTYERFNDSKLEGVTFDRNTAFSYGGAVSLYQRTDIEFLNCTFTRNKASNGGAVYLEKPYDYVQFFTSFTNVKFFYNRATLQGGGLSIDDGLIPITDSVFYSNRQGNATTRSNIFIRDDSSNITNVTCSETVFCDGLRGLSVYDKLPRNTNCKQLVSSGREELGNVHCKMKYQPI